MKWILLTGLLGSLLPSSQTLPAAFAQPTLVADDCSLPCVVAVDDLPVSVRYRSKGMLEKNDLSLSLLNQLATAFAEVPLQADSHSDLTPRATLSPILLSCRLLI